MRRCTAGIRIAVVLLATLLIAFSGCTAPGEAPGDARVSPSVTITSLPVPAATTALPVQPVVPVTPEKTTVPAPDTATTATLRPARTQLPEEALNARMVDARNKLAMLIDSNVADTVIVHPDGTQDCEVKKSKELGYLIDASTGESTFVKGDYWSIDGDLFSGTMQKDREYIIIHTHPRMWVTCGNTGVISLYSFSIGDLAATGNLAEQGYHVKKLIAIADKEYRIWPKQPDDWKNESEVRRAIQRIEERGGRPFSYYDRLLDHEFYDVDNLMPLLSKELNYTYTINSAVIS
jgi:hypothetical protein